MTSVGVEALVQAAPMARRLTTLSLRYNAVDSRGLRALGQSPGLPHLTALDVQTLDPADDDEVGVVALAESPMLAQLSLLDLGARLTPGGLRAILASPHIARRSALAIQRGSPTLFSLGY